tara:strand:- start:830 stop:1210 length:381 start_codon:yes stop_codon:yes gene_type:complete
MLVYYWHILPYNIRVANGGYSQSKEVAMSTKITRNPNNAWVGCSLDIQHWSPDCPTILPDELEDSTGWVQVGWSNLNPAPEGAAFDSLCFYETVVGDYHYLISQFNSMMGATFHVQRHNMAASREA